MTETRVRAWAYEQVHGRRLLISAAFLLSSLPLLFYSYIIMALPEVTIAFYLIVIALSALLQLCALSLVLEQAMGENRSLRGFFTCLRGGQLGRTLLLVLFFFLATVAVGLVPWLLEWHSNRLILSAMGEQDSMLQMMAAFEVYDRAASLRMTAKWIRMILNLVSTLLLFPIPYLFLTRKEMGVGQAIKRGVGFGARCFFKTAVFLLIVELPLGAALLLFLFLNNLVLRLQGAVFVFPLTASFLFFTAWYLPFSWMAKAGFALKLIGEKEEKSRPRRRMRLSNGDGWYYCGMSSGPKWMGRFHLPDADTEKQGKE